MLLFDKLSDKKETLETKQTFQKSIYDECDRYLQTRTINKKDLAISYLDEGLLQYGIDADIAYFDRKDVEKKIKKKICKNDKRINKILDINIYFEL